MSVKAYVLATVEAGVGVDVVKTLSAIEGVESAHNVTGPYDVIAFVEVADAEALGELVITRIQTVEGIVETLTCVVI
ncbi:TPA: Lrp/AsnC family transcriptional regulator [Candidatus Bipolaricaulota bacterium]|nr:Lrp/AsnC family transcriptional regulator [Candidatus Bipolaricaulota bacterium]